MIDMGNDAKVPNPRLVHVVQVTGWTFQVIGVAPNHSPSDPSASPSRPVSPHAPSRRSVRVRASHTAPPALPPTPRPAAAARSSRARASTVARTSPGDSGSPQRLRPVAVVRPAGRTARAASPGPAPGRVGVRVRQPAAALLVAHPERAEAQRLEPPSASATVIRSRLRIPVRRRAPTPAASPAARRPRSPPAAPAIPSISVHVPRPPPASSRAGAEERSARSRDSIGPLLRQLAQEVAAEAELARRYSRDAPSQAEVLAPPPLPRPHDRQRLARDRNAFHSNSLLVLPQQPVQLRRVVPGPSRGTAPCAAAAHRRDRVELQEPQAPHRLEHPARGPSSSCAWTAIRRASSRETGTGLPAMLRRLPRAGQAGKRQGGTRAATQFAGVRGRC